MGYATEMNNNNNNTKSLARQKAETADKMLRAGEDARTVAKQLGYKSVNGMLGAIALVRNQNERAEKSTTEPERDEDVKQPIYTIDLQLTEEEEKMIDKEIEEKGKASEQEVIYPFRTQEEREKQKSWVEWKIQRGTYEVIQYGHDNGVQIRNKRERMELIRMYSAEDLNELIKALKLVQAMLEE